MQTELTISKKQLRAALKNEVASAKAAKLVYVNDAMPGIQRIFKRNKFRYYFDNKEIIDTEILLRIKSLAIPPAWTQVWICNLPEGHLQATGYDTANRKQYKYHPLWNDIRSKTKYFRLLDFGLNLNKIREKIDEELKKPGLSKDKVLALVIAILDMAFIRIGNSAYEKLNGSYGLTTLKNTHVRIDGSNIKICFIGKKGIRTNVTLKNKRLSNVIKKCKEIPGKRLFEYINEDGTIGVIESGMVNDYLKELTGQEFTAKDFRTWAGSVSAIRALKELGHFTSQTDYKSKINQMYDIVAADLGNTRNVCRKHYVHPLVVKCYEENIINECFDAEKEFNEYEQLKSEERALLYLLKKI